MSDLLALAAEHFISLAVGVLVGFALSSRYRLVRRKEGDE